MAVEIPANTPVKKPACLRCHPLIPVLLLIGLFYLGNYNGLWSSNDGSHFALLKAMCDHGSFELGPGHVRYTLGVDFALSRQLAPATEIPKGIDFLVYPLQDPDDPFTPPLRIYSDRPPGTALLLIPFYAIGASYARLMQLDAVGTDNLEQLWACMGILFFALINLSLVYWGGRRLGASRSSAIVGALVFALAGLAFKYSSMIFSHTPSATTGLLGACLLFGPIPQKRRMLFFTSVGFLMGYAVAIEYQNAVFSGLFFLAWAYRLRQSHQGQLIAAIIAGAAVPALALGWYQYHCFGNFFAPTHSFNPTMPHNQSLSKIFSGNMINGFKEMFWKRKTGVLSTAPIFLFGAWGLVRARRNNPLAWLPLAAAALYALIIAHHATIEGGATHDCRYLFPAVALIALGLAPALDAIQRIDRLFLRVSLIAAFAAVAFYSMVTSTYLAVDKKLGTHSVTQDLDKLPAWESFCIKYDTFSDPAHNLDRLDQTYVLPRYRSLTPDFVIVPLHPTDS